MSEQVIIQIITAIVSIFTVWQQNKKSNKKLDETKAEITQTLENGIQNQVNTSTTKEQ